MKNYKFSIITVTLNSEKFLERCLNSVKNLNHKNFEHIIIDGGSTDSTIKILKSNETNFTKMIFEKDNGIWDAMNKGINLAGGDIIGFLNSGDVYFQNTLFNVDKYFSRNQIDFIFGAVEKYKLMYGYSPWKIKWSFGFYTSHSVGFFIKTHKHKEVGLYNTKYLSADLDFFYKMIINYKMKGLGAQRNEIFGKFEKGGFSSKINYIDHLNDLNQIRIDNGQNKFFVYFLYVIKILKKPFKFIKAYSKNL